MRKWECVCYIFKRREKERESVCVVKERVSENVSVKLLKGKESLCVCDSGRESKNMCYKEERVCVCVCVRVKESE